MDGSSLYLMDRHIPRHFVVVVIFIMRGVDAAGCVDSSGARATAMVMEFSARLTVSCCSRRAAILAVGAAVGLDVDRRVAG
jgi:hypothetical protein